MLKKKIAQLAYLTVVLQVEGKQKTSARTTMFALFCLWQHRLLSFFSLTFLSDEHRSEEKMTEALKRNCAKCGAGFYKEEGCNKMTCRCGALMCYICRATIPPKVGYAHFCQHNPPVGKPCTKCTACLLWTNAAQDDARAVEEARKAAQRELGELASEG